MACSADSAESAAKLCSTILQHLADHGLVAVFGRRLFFGEWCELDVHRLPCAAENALNRKPGHARHSVAPDGIVLIGVENEVSIVELLELVEHINELSQHDRFISLFVGQFRILFRTGK